MCWNYVQQKRKSRLIVFRSGWKDRIWRKWDDSEGLLNKSINISPKRKYIESTFAVPTKSNGSCKWRSRVIYGLMWIYTKCCCFFLQRISWAHTFCNLNVLHNKIDNLETVHKNWEEEYFTIKGENKKYGRMKHHVILTRYIA